MERQKLKKNIYGKSGKAKVDALLEYSQYLRQKDPKESLSAAKEAEKLCKELGDIDCILGALMHICYAYYYLENYSKARTITEEFLNSAKKNNSKISLGTAYGLLGRISTQEGKYKEAIENNLKALDLLLKDGDKEDLISIYNNLGQIHLKMLEIDEAEEYLKLALGYADELNHPARYPIRLNLANVIYNQSKYSEAMEIYKLLAEYFHDKEQYLYEAACLTNVGLCYKTLENYEESYIFYKDSLKLYEKLDNFEGICHTCSILCDIAIGLKKFDIALSNIQKAEKIALERNLIKEMEGIYDSFSLYYQSIGDYKLAIEYLQRVIKEKDKNHKEYNKEKISELEAKYKTEIYKLKNVELGNKNKAMKSQIAKLNSSLKELQETHNSLKIEFQQTSDKISEKDNLVNSQSRNVVIGEMISAIAHQWKQPLNVIWLLAQAIGDAWEYDEITEDFLEKQIGLIGSQINYMNETINDFRDFFKQDYVTDFSVAEAINKAYNLLDYSLMKSNVNLQLALDERCKLSGNPNELTQVILNIMNNARQALERSNQKDPLIKVSLTCNSHETMIIISNNGEPIRDENLKKLFDAYFTTRKKHGTGLGLHICKEIIESRFNGKITAHNSDSGVDFIIKIK